MIWSLTHGVLNILSAASTSIRYVRRLVTLDIAAGCIAGFFVRIIGIGDLDDAVGAVVVVGDGEAGGVCCGFYSLASLVGVRSSVLP